MHGPPADFHSDAELAALMTDAESDLVERKETFAGEAPNAVRQAICAFANDLPNHRRPGVIFIGVRDDGTPTGLEVNDALLLALAHCKTDGNILPLPTMTVGKRRLAGADVAVRVRIAALGVVGAVSRPFSARIAGRPRASAPATPRDEPSPPNVSAAIRAS